MIMSIYDDFYSAIDDIESFLSRDLIGPIKDDEIIESVDPLSYYVIGILWAKKLDKSIELSQEEDAEELSLERNLTEEMEDLLQNDDCISQANDYKPSAMGVSVMLPPDTNTLDISFSFGKYVYSEKEENHTKILQYTRIPYIIQTSARVPDKCRIVKLPLNDKFGVDITLTVRKIHKDGSRLVTISAANTAEVPQRKREQSENALFQCRLTVTNKRGFIPVYQNFSVNQNDEDQINSMLYRNVFNYAYGHGCSIRCESENGIVTTVSSDFMPKESVYQMMPGAIKESEILRLKYWETAEKDSACERLLRFVGEYASWRDIQTEHVKSLDGYNQSAAKTIERIGVCIKRLENGISELKNNDIAWKSFILMNEAMLLQRVKTKKLSDSQSANVSWYPFQLAYILQIIPDITIPDNIYRNSVDLLWFPTGGGKTEAYLGVSAFSIFYRRLSLPPATDDDGVTVIMRYTLRLLTIQQFERAAALICACEYLRRKYDIAGGEINIGLWIGGGMTPNHIDGEDGAARMIERLKQTPDERITEGNPVQITNCPWCGETIDLDGYNIVKNHLVINCNNNKQCEFHSSLPVYVVDDDVYETKPTILLSTIDKFARIAWELKSKALFGDKSTPPELIIQDELHLISGPLGSLAGVYEIAIEYLTAVKGRSPKIIASTATVKNAANQIRNLYNKKTVQFPPNGINHDDSFFAVKAEKTERPMRTYLGLCESGGSLTDLMIRVYANLIFTKSLFIKQKRANDIIDQYATIIGYFNALKDLGAADNIIRDRMFANIRTLAEYKFKSECVSAGLKFNDIRYGIQEELTSRKSSKEIKEALGRLEVSYPDASHYSIVLASNMLSVGIDINRLGLMTVYGQPKSNAEYIQATSRVGRQNPGLILTMFNSSRSRDRSHYEQFNYYHKSFYQYVEATSVTPYSARALEKALHCVFVAMLRLTYNLLGANDYAVNFRSNDAKTTEIIEYIITRIKDVYPETADFAADYLYEISDDWERLAKENPDTLVYADYSENNFSLLKSAEKNPISSFPPILNSLRNVEPSSNVYIEER